MKRRLLSFMIVLLIALQSGAKVYIPLVKSVPPSTGSSGNARVGIRTGMYAPLAYFEEDALFIQYPVRTATSVLITNDSTDVVVFSAQYDTELSDIKIDFSTFIKYQNCYNISVNAYGNWWVGYFDYDEYYLSIQESGQPGNNGYYFISNEPKEGFNFGISGIAGNASAGYNYATGGMLSDESEGAGIYGSSTVDYGINTWGRYAGFFHGDIKTTDAVYASAYNTLADSRLNSDVRQVESGILYELTQMNVLEYRLNQFDADGMVDSIGRGYYNSSSGIMDKEHYGLSGQEIREIYPSLVSENNEGYLSVNYVEMVPLLIQSIKELKAELDNTNAELEAIKSTAKVTDRISNQTIVLHQNVPNPFKDKCTVKCTIPTGSVDASLYLYDYNGRQIKNINIKERGDVQVAVDGNGLEAGIYLYSLIVDGQLVDTLKMVLTN